jgi:lipopolysaccharide export system protein LptA
MKYRILAFFLFVFLVFPSLVAAAPVIKSDSSYFDVSKGMYILKGNVSVQVGSRVITAGEAKVSPLSLEVWGTGGITLTQGDIYFTGDSVYVHGAQNTAQINDNVTFTRNDLSICADAADFNWKTKLGVFRGNVKVTKGDKTWTADSVTYNVETNLIE